MNLDKLYGTDEKKDVEGVEFELTDDNGEPTGAKVILGRFNNPAMKKLRDTLMSKHSKAFRKGKIPMSLIDEITLKCIAEKVLLGWSGLATTAPGGKSKELKFSKENALKLLTDYPLFREEISELSQDVDAYRRDLIEETKGN